MIGGVPVTPAGAAGRARQRAQHHRRGPRRPCRCRAGSCRRARRRRREDHLQLLAGAPDDAGGRPGAHVEPCRRAALRALFPPDLSRIWPAVTGVSRLGFAVAGSAAVAPRRQARCSDAHPALARLSPRRHRLERLHADACPRVEQRRARRHRPLAGAEPRALRPRRRGDGATRRGRPPARLRPRPLRRVRRAARAGLHARRARALGGGERLGDPRAPARRRRLHEPRPPRRAGRRCRGAPFAVKAHGSELEYSMRGNAELSAWGAEALAAARATFVGSEHIRDVLAEVCGHTENVFEVPPGVDIDEWVPETRDAAARCADRGGAT